MSTKAKPLQDRIASFGQQLFMLKAQKEDLENQLSKVNEQIKQIAEVDLAKLMADAEVEKVVLVKHGTIYLSDVFYASVLKDNREKLYQWMRENGHGDIISDYVHPQTLTAFAKEMTAKQEPLPDLIKVTVIPTAKTRRG